MPPTLELMFTILGWMLFIIVFLALLDIIFYMIRTVFGFSYKKFFIGMGIGMIFVILKDWYKKNHITLKDKGEVVDESEEVIDTIN